MTERVQETSSSSIVLPDISEVAEFGGLRSRESLRGTLEQTSSHELVEIVADSEQDLTLRFESARTLSTQLLAESVIAALLSHVELSTSWREDPESEGHIYQKRVPAYSTEQKLTGQIAALALQESTLKDTGLRAKALQMFLSANSSQAPDENQRAVLMLQGVTAKDEIADFVASWIAEVNREHWRTEALPLLVGINSETAAFAYGRVLFGLPDRDRDSELMRNVHRLQNREAPKANRRTLSGDPVPTEPGIADLLEPIAKGIESMTDSLTIARALGQLALYRPADELLDKVLGSLKEVYGLEGITLPEHFDLSLTDRMIKAALRATDRPRFKPGEEGETKEALFDITIASLAREFSETGPRSDTHNSIIGADGGQNLNAQLAVSVLMNELQLL